MTVRLVNQYEHSPPLLSAFEGGVQPLSGGEMFVGWGQQPYLTEFNAAGHIDFDAHFNVATSTYRAYRFPWEARPMTRPTLAIRPRSNGRASLYVSWNGATDVRSWRVLTGRSGSTLHAVTTAAKGGFETAIPVGAHQSCLEVQAVSRTGRVLATSRPIGVTACRRRKA
jgi:hypothetical protein